MSIVVDAIVGSTGLELKSDPGVPYVYAGFAGAPGRVGAVFCWLATQPALSMPCCCSLAYIRQRCFDFCNSKTLYP